MLRTLSIAKGSVFCLPQHLTPGPAVAGAVMCSGAEEGWGVIEVPGVPCGCFVHFADIQMNGYRSSGPVGACNSLSGASAPCRMAVRIALRSGQTADGGRASADRGPYGGQIMTLRTVD